MKLLFIEKTNVEEKQKLYLNFFLGAVCIYQYLVEEKQKLYLNFHLYFRYNLQTLLKRNKSCI